MKLMKSLIFFGILIFVVDCKTNDVEDSVNIEQAEQKDLSEENNKETNLSIEELLRVRVKVFQNRLVECTSVQSLQNNGFTDKCSKVHGVLKESAYLLSLLMQLNKVVENQEHFRKFTTSVYVSEEDSLVSIIKAWKEEHPEFAKYSRLQWTDNNKTALHVTLRDTSWAGCFEDIFTR